MILIVFAHFQHTANVVPEI